MSFELQSRNKLGSLWGIAMAKVRKEERVPEKVVSARAPKPAREARALPEGISERG
jgi:hypothetical protein